MTNYYTWVALLVALPSFLFGQLEWTVDGSLQSSILAGDTYYSTDTDTIQVVSPSYMIGDPLVWGSVRETSSGTEWDFAFRVVSFDPYTGSQYNNPDQSTDNAFVVLSTKRADWHIGFFSSLDNEIEVQLDFFEKGTYNNGTDTGTSKNIEFGVTAPHVGGVVQRLHAAEFYTIDNLNTNAPTIASLVDPHDQLNSGVFTTDTINTENQDVDEAWLEGGEASLPQDYPYSEPSSKVFLHTMEVAPYNTCSGCNTNGRLAPSEAAYEIRLNEGSSFSIKRKDLSKDGNLLSGMKSAIGLTGGGAALPVELSAFDAKATGQGVLLDWTTQSEEDNKGFFIERSRDLDIWESLDFVYGRGSSFTAIDYDFLDRAPYLGDSYYRLRQVDNDGTTAYSPIRSIRYSGVERSLKVFPNPMNENLQFELNGISYDNYIVEIYTMAGQLKERLKVSNSNLDLHQLPQGNYYLSIIPDGDESLRAGGTFTKL